MLQHSDLKDLFIAILSCYLYDLIKLPLFLEEKITLEISGQGLSVIIFLSLYIIYVTNSNYNEDD